MNSSSPESLLSKSGDSTNHTSTYNSVGQIASNATEETNIEKYEIQDDFNVTRRNKEALNRPVTHYDVFKREVNRGSPSSGFSSGSFETCYGVVNFHDRDKLKKLSTSIDSGEKK